MTRDIEWLQDSAEPNTGTTGNEFIVEMAKFWESRPTYNDTKQKWEINGRRGKKNGGKIF